MTFPQSILNSLGTRVHEALRDHCRLMEPTGALRRGDPTSSSIEFVCLTDDQEGIARRCLRHSYLAERTDQKLSVTLVSGLGVKLWFARIPKDDLFNPVGTNVEVLQTILTPTRRYLKGFVSHIRGRGFSLSRHQGLVTPDNRPVANTEAGIYAALGLELPPPSSMWDFQPCYERRRCPLPSAGGK